MVWAYGNYVWVAFHDHPGGNLSEVYVTTSSNNGTSWSNPLQLSKTVSNYSDTSFPFTVTSSNGRDVFVAWSQQFNPTTWSLLVSHSNDSGTTWTPPPGVNVSQNTNGTAASDNADLANAAIASYASSCFAVWELKTPTANQVYFSTLVYPEMISTTTSTTGSSSSTSSASSATSVTSTTGGSFSSSSTTAPSGNSTSTSSSL